MSARFIVVEGIDGSGKSTQVQKLSERLRSAGVSVWMTCEPTRAGVGAQIRAILTDPEATEHDRGSLPWLFALDRYHHVAEIQAALGRGEWVVCDRYVLSSLAYNTEYLGIFEVGGLNASFPLPDLTLVLDCTPNEAAVRIQKRGADLELFETRAQLARTDKAYRLAVRFMQASGARIEVVPAIGKSPDVHHRLWNHVQGLLP